MSLPTLIDAVAADLEAEVSSLPRHRLRKYVAPLVVTPELAPLLSVVPGEATPDLLATTDEYENHDDLLVTWHESFPEALTAGEVDAAKAKRAIERGEEIVARLKTYANEIPGYLDQAEATVSRVRYGMTDGGTFAVEVRLRVVTWA